MQTTAITQTAHCGARTTVGKARASAKVSTSANAVAQAAPRPPPCPLYHLTLSPPHAGPFPLLQACVRVAPAMRAATSSTSAFAGQRLSAKAARSTARRAAVAAQAKVRAGAAGRCCHCPCLLLPRGLAAGHVPQPAGKGGSACGGAPRG